MFENVKFKLEPIDLVYPGSRAIAHLRGVELKRATNGFVLEYKGKIKFISEREIEDIVASKEWEVLKNKICSLSKELINENNLPEIWECLYGGQNG